MHPIHFTEKQKHLYKVCVLCIKTGEAAKNITGPIYTIAARDMSLAAIHEVLLYAFLSNL